MNRSQPSLSSTNCPRTEDMMQNDEIIGGDKLILRGLMFHGFHGVKPEEKTLGQKFLIDVDAWMDLRAAGKSDQMSDTLSYTEIYRVVKEVVEGPSHNLLESVAQQIALTTLTKYPQISAVRVKVGKPHVAVHGPLDYLGVEILRRRIVDLPN
ncbi:dihydroneopterin aldolase 2 isoform X2 [Manihot esculenta]|uniref:7,8-dihydroneopterin aldolase n=4 Tax=Manihot esculenta TaxID=3983 RepID=A0A2C9VEN0_MANES|nr:dihydroneopterin aldolase 2 isoform X2 [Manihot esculenta]